MYFLGNSSTKNTNYTTSFFSFDDYWPQRAPNGAQNNIRSTEMPPALGGPLRAMSTSGLQPAKAFRGREGKDKGFHRVEKMFELRKFGCRRLEYPVQASIRRSFSNAGMRTKHLLQHDGFRGLERMEYRAQTERKALHQCTRAPK